MEDDYKERVTDLLKAIETRDELAESIKIAPPEMRREGQAILAEMNKDIDTVEAALADAYEAYQKFRRKEEELGEMNDQITVRLEEIFICIKHLAPELFAEMETKVFNGWSPENIQEFYDRVAIREATELEEIIAKNKKNVSRLIDGDNPDILTH
jgi:hypothetical protein